MASSHFVQLILPSRYCSHSSATRRVCVWSYVCFVRLCVCVLHVSLCPSLSPILFCTCYTLRITYKTSGTEPERKNAFHTKFTFMNRLTSKWRPEIKIILVQLHNGTLFLKKHKWIMKVWDFTCSNSDSYFLQALKSFQFNVWSFVVFRCCFATLRFYLYFCRAKKSRIEFYSILFTNRKNLDKHADFTFN